MTKKWLQKSPWPERFKDGWKNMSKEHKREFMNKSWQEHLRTEYEYALDSFGIEDGTDWDNLTDEQKQHVENEVKRHAQEMQAFGKAIAEGNTDEFIKENFEGKNK